MTSQEQMNKTYWQIKSKERKQYAHKEKPQKTTEYLKGYEDGLKRGRILGKMEGYTKGWNACKFINKL